MYDEEPYGFYHIKYESYCRNRGDNTYVGQNEVDMDSEVRIAENIVDIGADEVSCEDTWNENDWTFDGVINMEEFAVFSAAWRSHDPNDPVCNPNNPGYVSDPNAPGYISASAKANWNPTCNLDTNGAGVYAIDIYDFTAFCENWLWQACWRGDIESAGGGLRLEPQPMPETMLQAEKVATEVIPQKSVKEQIIDLKKTVEFLEKVWLTEPDVQQDIDAQQWQRFMDDIYNSLTELQNIKTKQYIEETLQ